MPIKREKLGLEKRKNMERREGKRGNVVFCACLNVRV